MKSRREGIENKRLKFLPGEQKYFLEIITKKNNFSIKEMAKILKIHPRSFQDWKKEKVHITLLGAKLLSQKYNVELPESEEILVNRWKAYITNANKIGGFARFRKYGVFATQEGRSKGGKEAMRILRQRGIISQRKEYLKPVYGEKLAEFVGIMLGDGGMTNEQCTITLNSEADREYIQFVCKLCVDLFGKNPKFYKRKNERTAIVYYYGQDLINFLIGIGLKKGNKVKQQVKVPTWILKNKKYKKACLRGLMDTDGGIFVHKYRANNKEYSYNKACFTNRSIPLLYFVRDILRDLHFTPKLIDKVVNKKVWLYNAKEIARYLQVVGSNNFRLFGKESGPDGKAQVC